MCDEERGMSYGGMSVHDSYVCSIFIFLTFRAFAVLGEGAGRSARIDTRHHRLVRVL